MGEVCGGGVWGRCVGEVCEGKDVLKLNLQMFVAFYRSVFCRQGIVGVVVLSCFKCRYGLLSPADEIYRPLMLYVGTKCCGCYTL